jgi:Flp pilus assembly protein TadD/mono/diheme cytochrome c family protein
MLDRESEGCEEFIAMKRGLRDLGAGVLLVSGAVLICVSWHGAGVVRASEAQVTWRRQIAPIVYKNCTSCHHAGGSGPFSLMTYADAKRWGSVMTTVTANRYMPPWLPEPGYGAFADERRLTDEQIALVSAWLADGMPEGDGDVPTAPVYSTDWTMGPPDLVLEMNTTMQVPASGTDLFENFVLPNPLKTTKWVRAMEIKPGSPQVVHHANVILDRTASLRRAHPADWQKGVPGMDILVDSGDNFDPDSHFLFWKPDSTALVEPEGMPWRLDAGDDLILNMHLKPTGKVETVRARVGLYFADKPATQRPMLLQLEHDAAIDIPAGDTDFVVEDELKLPVAVEVLGVYPHAHYLGKRMEGWATLPSGERRWLVLIKSWDINRQSVYRFAQPVVLPRGSVVHMRYTYDNSAGNVRNPNSPPVRVKAGNRSVDEMGHLWLQVLPIPEKSDGASDPRMALEQAWMEDRLRKDANDDLALYNLASLAMMQADPARAQNLYRRALEVRPDDARTMTALGTAMEASGDWRSAQTEYRAALEHDPEYADAAFDLGSVDLRHDALQEAERLFRGLTASHPEDISARDALASAFLATGHSDDAKKEYEEVLVIAPTNFEALYGLARTKVDAGDLQGAESLLTRAIAVENDKDAQRLLAIVYAGTGAQEKAVEHLEEWQRLAPADPEPHRALAQVYSQLGRGQDALKEQRTVVKLAPEDAGDWNDLAVMEARAGDRAQAKLDLEHAIQLDPNNEAIRANLSKF